MTQALLSLNADSRTTSPARNSSIFVMSDGALVAIWVEGINGPGTDRVVRRYRSPDGVTWYRLSDLLLGSLLGTTDPDGSKQIYPLFSQSVDGADTIAAFAIAVPASASFMFVMNYSAVQKDFTSDSIIGSYTPTNAWDGLGTGTGTLRSGYTDYGKMLYDAAHTDHIVVFDALVAGQEYIYLIAWDTATGKITELRFTNAPNATCRFPDMNIRSGAPSFISLVYQRTNYAFRSYSYDGATFSVVAAEEVIPGTPTISAGGPRCFTNVAGLTIQIVYENFTTNPALITRERTGAATYSAAVEIATDLPYGTYLTTVGPEDQFAIVKVGTDDFYVFYKKTTANFRGELYYVRRNAGVWGAQTPWKTGANGFNHPSTGPFVVGADHKLHMLFSRGSQVYPGSWSLFYDFLYDGTPSAPTGVTPNTQGETSATPTVRATYVQNRPLDLLGKYRVLVKRLSDATVFWDTGSAGTAYTGAIIQPGGTFSIVYAGTALVKRTVYTLEVSFWDKDEAYGGPLSTAVRFAWNDPPSKVAASLATDPTNGRQRLALYPLAPTSAELAPLQADLYRKLSADTIFSLLTPTGYEDVFEDVFDDLADWVSIAGTATISNNILTGSAGAVAFRAASGTKYRNGVWSATFKYSVDEAVNVGVEKWLSQNDRVLASLVGGATDLLKVIKVIGGAVTDVATVAFAPVVGRWYHIDLVADGRRYVARLYDTASSSPGVTKAASQLVAETAIAQIDDASVVEGEYAIHSTLSAATQFGGIASLPGGAYLSQTRIMEFLEPVVDTGFAAYRQLPEKIARNLITNGGFLAGKHGWTLNANASVVVDATSPSGYAVRNVATGGAQATHQIVPVEAGKAYSFAAQARSDGTTQARLSVNWLDTAGVVISTISPATTTGTSYTQLNLTNQTAPGNARSAQPILDTNVAGIVHLTGVRVMQQTGAPAAWATAHQQYLTRGRAIYEAGTNSAGTDADMETAGVANYTATTATLTKTASPFAGTQRLTVTNTGANGYAAKTGALAAGQAITASVRCIGADAGAGLQLFSTPSGTGGGTDFSASAGWTTRRVSGVIAGGDTGWEVRLVGGTGAAVASHFDNLAVENKAYDTMNADPSGQAYALAARTVSAVTLPVPAAFDLANFAVVVVIRLDHTAASFRRMFEFQVDANNFLAGYIDPTGIINVQKLRASSVSVTLGDGGATAPTAGDTVVFGFRFSAAAGMKSFISKNGGAVATYTPAAASVAESLVPVPGVVTTLSLGRTPVAAQELDGTVGVFRVLKGGLTDATISALVSDPYQQPTDNDLAVWQFEGFTSQVPAFDDRLVKLGTSYDWRAIATARTATPTQSTGEQISGSVAASAIDAWWLRDATDPTKDVQLYVAHDAGYSFARGRPLAVGTPLQGGPRSVTLGAAPYGDEGTLRLIYPTAALRDATEVALKAILATNNKTYLQDPFGLLRCVRISAPIRFAPELTPAVLEADLEFIEVPE